MGSSVRSSEASEAWRALLTAFTTVHQLLAREMEDAVGLPIEHYEILLMLYQADGEAMRPSEIAQTRRLSRSGATRLIDRLEREQLVERRRFGTDRRGSLVTLTPIGRETFIKAGRIHLKGIERYVGASLTVEELRALPRILAKLTETQALRRSLDEGQRRSPE